MAHMEVDANDPFEIKGQTITQLIAWLGRQDPSAHLELDGSGTVQFKRRRLVDGGGLVVEVVKETKRRQRTKSQEEEVLEETGVSKTDSPAEAERVVAEADNELNLDKADTTDQGGTVPGTGKTASEKPSNTAKK